MNPPGDGQGGGAGDGWADGTDDGQGDGAGDSGDGAVDGFADGADDSADGNDGAADGTDDSADGNDGPLDGADDSADGNDGPLDGADDSADGADDSADGTDDSADGADDSTDGEDDSSDDGDDEYECVEDEEWSCSGLTEFEAYPAEGTDECEDFSGCDYLGLLKAFPEGPQPLSFFMEENVAAVHLDDYDDYEWHTLRLKAGNKTIDVTVWDACNDEDCNGCCSENKRETGFLIDLEKYTYERLGTDSDYVKWKCLDC